MVIEIFDVNRSGYMLYFCAQPHPFKEVSKTETANRKLCNVKHKYSWIIILLTEAPQLLAQADR